MGAILNFEDALQCQVSQPMELPQNVDAKLPFVNKNFRLTEVGVLSKKTHCPSLCETVSGISDASCRKENKNTIHIQMRKPRKTFPWFSQQLLASFREAGAQSRAFTGSKSFASERAPVLAGAAAVLIVTCHSRPNSALDS